MELSNLNRGPKWIMGVNESNSPVEIGFFKSCADVMHHHESVYEYYVVLEGSLILRLQNKELALKKHDVLCVFPNEDHAVIQTSPDLQCMLLKYPHLPDDKILTKP